MRLGPRKFDVIAIAAAVALSTLSCGPKVVVAKLATPVAQAPPAATATPRAERQATPRPPASPAPAQVPTSTRPAASPTAPPTRTAAPPTVTAARAFTPTPTPTSTKAPKPAAAIPPPTSTASPIPPATATAVPRQPSPPPSPTPAPVLPSPVPTVRETSPVPPPTAPASLRGEWDFRADAGKGVIAGTLKFRPTPSGLTGVYVGLHGNATELSNLHATGAGVSFDLVTPTAVWHLDGTLLGDTIDGTFQTAERQIRWTAVRKPAPPPATPRS